MINGLELRNQYLLLRHGMSRANKEGIIASGLAGWFGYGLTEEGKQQVRERVEQAKKDGIVDQYTILQTSPLKRARQTARITAEVLGIPRRKIRIRLGLRERYFGLYEKKSQRHYRYSVWPLDPVFPDKRPDKVESTDIVQKRTLAVVKKLERKYKDKNILLVGHGDPHQILETAVAGIGSGDHRSMQAMGNATLWDLNRAHEPEIVRDENISMIGLTGIGGKTTLAKELAKRLGDKVSIIKYDDYYIKHKKRMHSFIDEESPCTFDNEAFIADVKRLREGKPTDPKDSERTVVEPRPIVIVEGYLVLTDRRVRNMLDKSFFLTVSEEELLKRRKQRRDHVHPNEHETDEYLEQVMLPGYRRYVVPQQHFTTSVLDARKLPHVLAEEVLATVPKR